MPETARIALVIDFETASEIDVRKVGARTYAQHPTTRVICYSFQVLRPDSQGLKYERDGPVVEVLGDAVHHVIRAATGMGGLFVAHYCPFERAIWEELLAARRSWPTCPALPFWRDTQAIAAVSGLPLSLEGASEAADLPYKKDTEGHALMLRMARPRSTNPTVWWHHTDQAKVQRLSEYCAADVSATTELFSTRNVNFIGPYETQLWMLTQRMNERGVGVDIDLVDRMLRIADIAMAEYNAECSTLTRGAVSTLNASVALRDYLDRQGLNLPDVRRATVEKALTRMKATVAVPPPGSPRERTQRLLELRLMAAKSSVAKLKSLKAHADRHGIVHDMQAHCGAGRTRRWAGRGPQPHNFPRPERGLFVDQAIEMIKAGVDGPGLELFTGFDVMTVLSSCLRGCLVAPTDTTDPARPEPRLSNKLVVADFSAVEARVLPWLAGEDWVLDVFRAGRDIYVETSNRIAKSLAVQVAIDRAFGKLTVLSCGYQTGGPKLRTTAEEDYGIVMTEQEAADTVRAWREQNPNIVQFWYALDSAAIDAVRHGDGYPNRTGKWFPVGPHVAFRMVTGHLYMRLPSNKTLVYRDAQIEHDTQFNRDGVTFMGVDSYTKKWKRLRGYGGLWANNVTQGTARDLLAEVLIRVDQSARRSSGMLVPSLTIHDEAVCIWREGCGTPARALKWLLKLMARPPSWAPGLPLAAEGYVADRLKKG